MRHQSRPLILLSKIRGGQTYDHYAEKQLSRQNGDDAFRNGPGCVSHEIRAFHGRLRILRAG